VRASINVVTKKDDGVATVGDGLNLAEHVTQRFKVAVDVADGDGGHV
jgi:hypothetical protein